MNQFRTFAISFVLSLFLAGFIITVLSPNTLYAQVVKGQLLSKETGPVLEEESYLYADIDTTKQRIFVLVDSGLWQFDLPTTRWTFLDSLQTRPEDIQEFEFGYNSGTNKLQLWSRGVGLVYEINLNNYAVKRVDDSFDHKNQYAHYPFYDSTGTLHAFGGYGFWDWENQLTFYNSRINEWNLQPVVPSSTFPSPRSPYTGAYSSPKNQLFIYGGSHPQSGRQDDHFTTINQKHDIWSYSFADDRWTEIGNFSIDSLEFHKTSALKALSRVNKISSSAFSPQSNLWYLPFRRVNQTKDIIYFKPIDVNNGTMHDLFRINFGSSKQFMPANFFYNQPSQSLVFVGFDNLTNTDMLPIRVYTVNESAILASFSQSKGGKNWLAWIGGIGFFILLFILALIIGRKKLGPSPETSTDQFSLQNIEDQKWLTGDERKMISYLNREKRFYETHEIESHMWPAIENYDYRRRLRNDLIKTINRKVQSNTRWNEDLIITKADPADRRKNLYGINSNFEE